MYRRRFLATTGLALVGVIAVPAPSARAATRRLRRQDDALARQWMSRAGRLKTRYYDVMTDLPREQAVSLTRHMDGMVDAYLGMFSGFRIGKQFRLELWAFQSSEDYHRVLAFELGARLPGSQGACCTRGTRIVLAGWQGHTGEERMYRLFQHEGFHQIASAMFPSMPTWANEGTAEVFEAACVIRGRLVTGDVPAGQLRRLRKASEERALRPFAEFVRMNSTTWKGHVAAGAAGLNYTQAWSMVHFLLYAGHGRHQGDYLRYLGLMNEGRSGDSAWQAVFGSDFAGWQRQYLEYLDALRPTDIRLTADRLEFLAAGARTLTETGARPATLAELRDRLRDRGYRHEVVDGRRHGAVDAMDDASFIVPGGDASGAGPRFVLEEDPRVPASRRQRVPPSITTVDAFPRRLRMVFSLRRNRIEDRLLLDE